MKVPSCPFISPPSCHLYSFLCNHLVSFLTSHLVERLRRRLFHHPKLRGWELAFSVASHGSSQMEVSRRYRLSSTVEKKILRKREVCRTRQKSPPSHLFSISHSTLFHLFFPSIFFILSFFFVSHSFSYFLSIIQICAASPMKPKLQNHPAT